MHKKYLAICIATTAIGFAATKIYRPYIYSHKLFDFYLADTIGSLVCVIASCALIWSYKDVPTDKKNGNILLATFIYSVIWKGLPALKTHRLDWHDMVAVCISAMITYVIKEQVDKKKFFYKTAV